METNNIKVLVIDDDQQILDTTTVVLRLNGFSVFTASSGRQGIKKAIEFKPDIILLDIWLPDIDGFHVYLELKKDPELAHTPIIFITGDETLDIERGFSVGGDDCIIKPIDPKYLVSRIWKFVKKKTKIVIVDDDRQICDMLQKVMERKGFEVDVMYDGIQLMDLLRTKKPDMLLLDLSLSIGPSGVEICRMVKSDQETKGTSIVVMTASEDIENVDNCFDFGAEDYIFKPFDVSDLLLRIKKLQQVNTR